MWANELLLKMRESESGGRSVQMTLDELMAKRDQLVLEKRGLETKLAAIKNLVRSSGRMPHDKYKACCDSQTAYTRKIIGVEAKILPVKAEIRRLSDQEHDSKTVRFNNISAQELVWLLREVRDKWQEFSCDDTLGTSTERTLAAQFVRDLNPVLHKIIG
jgi:hypothetical protein